VARQASPGIQTKATDEGVKTIAKVEVALQKKMKNGKVRLVEGNQVWRSGQELRGEEVAATTTGRRRISTS
jgi:uncharacterized membrane-anchored protein